MPREPSRNLRQEAERKVEQRFAQQREALFASHKEQRDRDLRAQEYAVNRLAKEQTRLADQKRDMIEQHERQWDRDRNRLALKPAPVFGSPGYSPRSLENEYRELRTRWLAQRDAIETSFDERIGACKTAQDDLRFAFDAANEIQAQRDREAYDALVQGQDRTRTTAIQREESRMEQSITQEFTRHSRDAGQERGL